MKTVSVNIMNLCVPCENHGRYCLLSWNGKLLGVEYERSASYARRFYNWVRENRPELMLTFGFGYSMEHPKLLEAIDFMNEIGSPTGKFLQLDGMRFRSTAEIRSFLSDVQTHGVEQVNLTFYGTREYHDRFAARRGDFDFMVEILGQTNAIGLSASAGVPLTRENAGQADSLIEELTRFALGHLFFFIPHQEGRGGQPEQCQAPSGGLCIPKRSGEAAPEYGEVSDGKAMVGGKPILRTTEPCLISFFDTRKHCLF